MMTTNRLLHAMWDGAVRPCPTGRSKTFDRFLSHFVPVDCVLLTIDDTYAQPRAMSEDLHLLPGVSLGDVIAEELDAHVPFGAVVLIRHAAALDNPSHAVGFAVGELLLAMVERSGLPSGRSDAAMMELAGFYSAMAATDAARALGLDYRDFCQGMSDMFRDHWATVGIASGLAPRTDAATRQIPAFLTASPQPHRPRRVSFDRWSGDVGARYLRKAAPSRELGGSSRIN